MSYGIFMRMLLPLLAISVGSCATSGPREQTTDVICVIGPLLFHTNDVINAVLEDKIIALNEYGAKYCKWLPPNRAKA